MADQLVFDVSLDISKEPESAQVELKNFEDLKAKIDEGLNDYRNMVVTDINAGDAKEMRARLRKLKKALSDERLRIQKLFLVNFKLFEKQTKELEKLVGSVADELDENIKALDPPESVNTYNISLDCTPSQYEKVLKYLAKEGIGYKETKKAS